MSRPPKIWSPLLFALLTLVSLTITLMGTPFIALPMALHAQFAPWLYVGGLFTLCGVLGFFISTWVIYVPTWEQKHSLIQTQLQIGNVWPPILMFPYSNSSWFLVLTPVIGIVGFYCASGNAWVFLLLVLPPVFLLMEAAFGRQFFGLTPEGVVWRAISLGTEYDAQLSICQSIQFLPWALISGSRATFSVLSCLYYRMQETHATLYNVLALARYNQSALKELAAKGDL